MRWASAVSDSTSLSEAVQHACEQTIENLEGERADLVLAFVSPHHASSYLSVPELVRSHFGGVPFVGCSARGVIGGGHEVERRAGVAIAAASLPGVNISPFHVTQEMLPGQDAPPQAWENALRASASDTASLVVLPDPFSMDGESLVAGLDFAFPGSVKVGGQASGGRRQGDNALFLDDRTLRSGAVGLALTGNLRVDTVVSQGCRPIGSPGVISDCTRNVIGRIGERTPLEVLHELFEAADDSDRRLIRRSLQVGVVMDPLASTYTAGDFLIRNILGIDEDDGSLSVGEVMREGQVVQFHVRDAAAATEDLGAVLERYTAERGKLAGPAGALLFSCVGRGQFLFGTVDHDTELFQSMVAPLPLAGFFCNGEIGPVGGSTFLHGYTSSFALFSPAGTLAP